MTGALLVTAAWMGFAGTVHCAGMCAAACAAIGTGCVPGAPRRGTAAWLAGRLLGYTLAGIGVGAAVQGLRWLVGAAVWLQPLWAMAQVALAGLGLWLLLRGELPPTLQQCADRLGRPRQPALPRVHLPGELSAASIGLAWPLLPCGLLHAALAVAALASSPLESGQVMAAFAVSSSAGLVGGGTLWRRLIGGGTASLKGAGAIRLAGASVVAFTVWPLLRGVWGPLQAAWCG